MTTGLPLRGPPLQLQQEGQGVQLATDRSVDRGALPLPVLLGWLHTERQDDNSDDDDNEEEKEGEEEEDSRVPDQNGVSQA